MKKIALIFCIMLLPLMFFAGCDISPVKYKLQFIVDDAVYYTIDTAGSEIISLPNNPTKDGYEFMGWYLDENTWLDELTSDYYSNTEIVKDIKVYAYFSPLNPTLATSVSLNKEELYLNVNENYNLIATIQPSDTTNKTLTWSISNPSVATVDNGLVKALTKGSAVVTVKTSNNMTDTCNIYVVDKNEDISVNVYIDNELTETLTTNHSKGYKITPPQKPEDITTNPNAEKYFYGWFVDANYQTLLTEDSIFNTNSNIYGKWIDVYVNDFAYTVYKGKATITSLHNHNNLTILVIPSYINAFPVEKIGLRAFADKTLIRNVIICNGIKEIDSYAFYNCNSMTNIILPDTLKTINSNAFNCCSLLAKIVIPNNVSFIGEYSFANCETLMEINIPDSVEAIKNYCFSECINLTNILIPNGVKVVENYAFYNCTSLTSIYISNTVGIIGEGVFGGCSSLNEITMPSIEIKKIVNGYNYLYCIGYIFGTKYYEGSLEIKEIITNLDTHLIVTRDESYYIPKHLETLNLLDGNISYYSFYNFKTLINLNLLGDTKIIGSGAFSDCTNIKKIKMSNSVTDIESNAFRNCSSLVEIIFSESLLHIGDAVFSSCVNLLSINLPDNVINIGQQIFRKCTQLTSVTMSKELISIGQMAFYECPNLSNVYFKNTANWIVEDNSFSSCLLSSYDLSSPTVATTYLQSTYSYYTWKRN